MIKVTLPFQQIHQLEEISFQRDNGFFEKDFDEIKVQDSARDGFQSPQQSMVSQASSKHGT
jgi:hypothetical protein